MIPNCSSRKSGSIIWIHKCANIWEMSCKGSDGPPSCSTNVGDRKHRASARCQIILESAYAIKGMFTAHFLIQFTAHLNYYNLRPARTAVTDCSRWSDCCLSGSEPVHDMKHFVNIHRFCQMFIHPGALGHCHVFLECIGCHRQYWYA